MEETNALRQIYGLLGKNISYSFSRAFFTEKFERESIEAHYLNFDVASVDEFSSILKEYPALKGMNVTIPYKEAVISFLDELDTLPQQIGAVNTIKIYADGRCKGFNTDYIGFEKTIAPLLSDEVTTALVLGTGGASKAIEAVLLNRGIAVQFVSREPVDRAISYAELSAEYIQNYPLIVNCTPLGSVQYPDTYPALPYEALTEKHILYDLIYTPAETLFLSKGKAKGATICNGHQMLIEQANAAWEIWNDVSK